jgi:penicillin V acylase-like amidase (Ntn superfamily)
MIMCTALTLQSQQRQTFFGRTMDFSYDIEPKLYVLPKNYGWYNVLNSMGFYNSYRIIGIGQETDGMFAFFDGVNENGFAAAALYFAGYAKFDTQITLKNKQPVSSLDFLHYILGKCGSVDQLAEVLNQIYIVGLPDPVTHAVAPLHWIAADKSGKCVVIEQTGRGLEILPNDIGVMANSPDFEWHMTNLRNYIGVSPNQINEARWGNVQLRPFGQAGGSTMLPGGFTSPERFVRTAFLKTHVRAPENTNEAVITCFNIMNSVTIPKGIVVTDHDTCDYTKYTAFINTNTCEYFFRTHDNPQITTVSLWDYQAVTQAVCIGALNRSVVFEKM